MGWSAGTFSRTNGTYSGANVWAQDSGAGFDIEAARMDSHDQDIATGINNTLTKDGQNSPSSHLNWLSTERNINSTSGSSSNYTASLANAPASYFTGLNFKFVPNHTNTGAATINVNGLGSQNIKIIADTAGTKDDPAEGQVVQGYPTELYYDGTDFILIGQPPVVFSSWTPTYGGISSMTYTSVSTTHAVYAQSGKSVYFSIRADGTTGGTASGAITFTLPVTAERANHTFSCFVTDGSTVAGWAANSSATVVQVYKYNTVNYGLGSGRVIAVSGTYEAA